MIRLSARGICAAWEGESGHLPDLTIGGRAVLHAAPWRNDQAVQYDATIPLVDRRLGGTFICAPFGRDDLDNGPPHGGVANAPWRLRRVTGSALTACTTFSRGRAEARFVLRDGHPVLYQTHVLDLDAPCTFAHHPIFALSGGGRLSASDQRAILTFDAEHPVFSASQRTVPWTLDTPEGPRDLRDLPTETAEDFVTLVADGGALGWTALARSAEGDTIVTLRRADQLPVTNLWLSNRARMTAPWNGRYGPVVSIEDAICAGAEGNRAAISGQSRVAKEGVATALKPGRHVIPHAILRLDGCHDIKGITMDADALQITTTDTAFGVPFDGGHFA